MPGDPLEAASTFYGHHVKPIEVGLSVLDILTVQLPAVPETHEQYLRAAMGALARKVAPRRINAISGNDDAAMERAAAWLASAPGITGQYFAVDGAGPQAALG